MMSARFQDLRYAARSLRKALSTLAPASTAAARRHTICSCIASHGTSPGTWSRCAARAYRDDGVRSDAIAASRGATNNVAAL